MPCVFCGVWIERPQWHCYGTMPSWEHHMSAQRISHHMVEYNGSAYWAVCPLCEAIETVLTGVRRVARNHDAFAEVRREVEYFLNELRARLEFMDVLQRSDSLHVLETRPQSSQTSGDAGGSSSGGGVIHRTAFPRIELIQLPYSPSDSCGTSRSSTDRGSRSASVLPDSGAS